MKRIISFVLTAALLAGVLSVGVSAGVIAYIDCGMITQFIKYCYAGNFYSDEFVAFGYSGAKILKTREIYEWNTYDAKIILSFCDDDMNKNPGQYLGLVCRLTDPRDDLPEDKVPCIKFFYDVERGSFLLLSGEGYYYSDSDAVIGEVPMEIDTAGREWHNFGMSVNDDSIRCFYNGVMIFEYTDPAIGEETAPFVFINGGNFVQITAIKVTTPEYLYPRDITGDDRVNLADVTVLLKSIAKWEGYSITGKDYNDDGEVNLTDVAWLMQYIAGWYD